jgi:hypothetical protein
LAATKVDFTYKLQVENLGAVATNVTAVTTSIARDEPAAHLRLVFRLCAAGHPSGAH